MESTGISPQTGTPNRAAARLAQVRRHCLGKRTVHQIGTAAVADTSEQKTSQQKLVSGDAAFDFEKFERNSEKLKKMNEVMFKTQMLMVKVMAAFTSIPIAVMAFRMHLNEKYRVKELRRLKQEELERNYVYPISFVTAIAIALVAVRTLRQLNSSIK